MAKRRNFGDVALRKGYISEETLKKALEIQKKEQKRGRYPLLGLVLLKMGAITSTQLIEIILELEEKSHPGGG
ncbi:MAG: hypothetical protein DRP90_07730 [Planctomycetota bacterium]|nr:MAG: hypothetical protein DRP90_07730 [Planctomycetota bacterium]